MKSKLLFVVIAIIAFTCSSTFSNAQCSNVTSGATIGSNQSGCSSLNPAIMTASVLPAGGTGTLQYQWQSSPNNSTWTNISFATSQNYDPSTITTTTYYRQLSRRSGCTTYDGVSNVVTKTVNPLPIASITAGGPTTFCGPGSVLVSANAGAGINFQWRKNGSIVSGATNQTYSATSTGTYTVTETIAATGCSGTSNGIAVYDDAALVTTVSDNGFLFCTASTVMLAVPNAPHYTYQWFEDSNAIPNSNFSQLSTGHDGTFSCTITNTCGSHPSNPVSVNDFVFSGRDEFGSIEAFLGTTSVCTGDLVPLYEVASNTAFPAFQNYQWYLNGAPISGATDYGMLTSQPGIYTLRITTNDLCTFSPYSYFTNFIPVTVNATPTVSISPGGPTTFCQGVGVLLNATATGGNLTYQWYRGVNPVSGATSSSYNTFLAGSFTCRATNNCGQTTSNAIIVTVINDFTPLIHAATSTTFCSGGSVVLNATPTGAAYTYQWRLNGSDISGATSTLYTATATGNYTCSVTSSPCMFNHVTGAIAVTVLTTPTATITANGATNFCSGSTVVLSANTGPGLFYQWSVDGNNIALATASTYTAATGGTYACAVTNACGTVTSNIIVVTVSAPPLAPGAVAGTSTICLNSFAIQYSVNAVSGATSYAWTVPAGATISQGQGTTEIYVDFGGSVANGSNICVSSVNGCGTSSPSCLTISTSSVPQIPNSISGSSSACANTNNNVYSILGVIGATSYTWTLPTGASFISGQGTSSVTLSFGANGATGNICVYAGNACGTNVTCKQVTAVTGTTMPASISGTATPCANSTGVSYSCPVVTGASSYIWTVPVGATITSGQGTTAITVNFNPSFSSGTIGVSSVNCAGTSAPRTLQVYGTPAMPGTITGQTTVCGGTTNVQYTIAAVTGATSYTWTAPSNATITNGQGTTTLRLNFGNGFSSGTLSVRSVNSCGTSAPRTLAITSVPPIPGAISGPATFCANSNIVYSVSAVTGATTYSWVVPNGATITNGQGTTTVTVHHGTHSGKIKVRAGNACGYSAYQILNVTKTCREAGEALIEESDFGVSVFPNPSANQFTISVKSEIEQKYNFILRDLTGKLVEMRENQLTGQPLEFGINLMNGIYVAEIVMGDERKWIRIIKQE